MNQANLFEGMSQQEINRFLININRYNLNSKTHIKKYKHYRNLHSTIIDNMWEYIHKGHYNLIDNFHKIEPNIAKETNNLGFYVEDDDKDGTNILTELFLYPNHKKLPYLTEIYLEKNKFRNEEKVKMLESMKNSYVSLFKIIDANRDEGYVTYQDVFTNKKFQVIDITMSSTLFIKKSPLIYIYNRLITIDNITFATSIHCVMLETHPGLKKLIKKCRQSKLSNFSKCLLFYTLSQKNNNIKITYNNQYSCRR